MKEILTLLIMILRTYLIILSPGGVKKLSAENLNLRRQLIASTRKNPRSPPLSLLDRLVFGFTAFFISKSRLEKISILVKPATILKFHRALVNKKYGLLFGTKGKKKLGRKGFDPSIVKLVLEIKKRNPCYGCPKIALLVSNSTGISISEQTVRRILRKYLRPNLGGGPSWQSFIGNQVDSLWSLDLFRCESIHLRSFWVMVVMDVYSRKIIGYSIQAKVCTGESLCRMLGEILSASGVIPKSVVCDNDPLFRYHQWQANFRLSGIEEIKSIPEIPWSNPYVERVIGSTRRECIDQVLFWNEEDLNRKLASYQKYFNEARVHESLNGMPPAQFRNEHDHNVIDLKKYHWQKHCGGLFQVPIAA